MISWLIPLCYRMRLLDAACDADHAARECRQLTAKLYNRTIQLGLSRNQLP
jgi:hypothetical protein